MEESRRAEVSKSGQTSFSRVEHEIRSVTHDALAALVANLLGSLMPPFAEARRLGDLDCMGVDVYAYDSETDLETIAVQCKGFERQFLPEHLKVIDKEVSKYLKQGPAAREYWLVVNKRIPNTLRAGALASLDRLLKAGKVEVVKLLDLPAFVAKLRALARELIEAAASEKREELRREYEARLKVVSYIEPVPFTRPDGDTNPSRWMTETIRGYLNVIHQEHIGKDRAPPRYLLTAEFGFGKTSALHAAADLWLQGGGHAIYVPAALLPDRAFVHGAGVAEALLLTIKPDLETYPHLAQLILRETLRKELARANDWLLLIDAVDESTSWEHHAKLAALWGGVADLGLPLIASVREELFQLRPSEFEVGDGRSFSRPYFQVLNLVDWPPELILEFLDRFHVDRGGEPPTQFARLKALVAAGEYESVYGDIPRRPLFLGMLAEDAWRDAEPEKDLHRLYETYLRRKLHEDRYSASAGGRVVRVGPLNRQWGSDEFVERLMRMMTEVAGTMLKVASRGEDSTTLVSEAVLGECAQAVGAQFSQSEEVALNSVLQPAGRDQITRQRQFRFAHKSFQDWFSAAYLVGHGSAADESRSEAVQRFATLMARDRA